ncbi:hypothetical protein JOE25_001205 [Serratia sp. PL17]|nr:hypothetical protein [Serratia sp. PL17]
MDGIKLETITILNYHPRIFFRVDLHRGTHVSHSPFTL